MKKLINLMYEGKQYAFMLNMQTKAMTVVDSNSKSLLEFCTNGEVFAFDKFLRKRRPIGNIKVIDGYWWFESKNKQVFKGNAVGEKQALFDTTIDITKKFLSDLILFPKYDDTLGLLYV